MEANSRCSCSHTSTRNAPNCVLQQGSHEYTDLVGIIARDANDPNNYSEQLNAYHKAGVRPDRDFTCARSNGPSIAWLRKWARIFDDAFFFGAIHKNDRYLVNWDPEQLDMYGFARGFECDYHRQAYRVKIFINPSPLLDPNDSLPLNLLDTLLHELCHAALMLYGCTRTVDAQILVMTIGLTDHGPSFFDLFETVSTAAKSRFGINFDHQRDSVASRKEEQTALEKVLDKAGATPSDVYEMNLATLEKNIAKHTDCSPDSFQLQKISREAFYQIRRRQRQR